MVRITHASWRHTVLSVAALALTSACASQAQPVSGEALAQRIREAASGQDGPGRPHPLPLAANWNTGHTRGGGFDPAYQLEQFRQGRYLLPWFELLRPDTPLPDTYYEPALREWAGLGMPIAFSSTQWDVLVAEKIAGNASSGAPPPLLRPDSPLEFWYEAGRRWSATPLLARLQAIYPEPPLVLFVSNNEQPKITWVQVRDQKIALPGLAAGADDDAVRRAVGDAWALRYRELIRGFRDGLASDHWRRHARFVGYEAFGQPAMGRWPGWPEYSLHSGDRFEPWSAAWEGASVSYYTPNWTTSSDFRVMSPQIESMNWVPMLEAARRVRPDFWFELSTWDGRSDDDARDKDDFYAALGQQWTPRRYSGMVQYGMWLMRPRTVREFRDPQSRPDRYHQDFVAIMDAVARVHENPVLARFWKAGRLVANTSAQHPYQADIPPRWQSLPRWFLLEAEGNPSRPWTLETPIPVFALALELGTAPSREWLVYASSPLDESRELRIRLRDGVQPKLRATQGGCFSRVVESGQRVQLVDC